jgi:predicted peptidase
LPSATQLPKVNLSISFTNAELLIKATVRDSHFKDGDRSWRYGDGFYINFVEPLENQKDSSNNFYGFGFSLQDKKPVSVLVNKDGNYFPNISAPPAPEIQIDELLKTAFYNIRIPWECVYPYHPFKNNLAGINIVYVSQNDDGSRIIQKLIEDNYDTESTRFRKYKPIEFIFSGKNKNYITGQIDKLIIESRSVPINLWIRSNKKTKSKIIIEANSEALPSTKRTIIKRLAPGINKIKYIIKLPRNNGLYSITAKLNDDIKWSDDVYKYSSGSFSQTIKVIKLLTDSSSNNEIRASANTIIYNTNELENSIKTFDVRNKIINIQAKFEILSSLVEQFSEDKTVFNKPSYLLAAFYSQIDSTLQPYSIILPENFNGEKQYNLMVVLHGSGVDEVSNIKSAAKNFATGNFIFIAPRGRSLSSWYVGDTEKDFVTLVKNIKEIFKIDKTILYGFSMGGYGVWRYGLIYPELFDAGIVVSGIPFNLSDKKPEYDMNNFIGKENKIPFLVVHGTADRSLDISYTDKFVELLKNRGFEINYERVNGGGHGNFNSTDIILSWLLKNGFNKI